MRIKLLTDDQGNRYLHGEILEEVLAFPEREYIYAEGDSCRLGETAKNSIGGWNVLLEPAEVPQGVGTLPICLTLCIALRKAFSYFLSISVIVIAIRLGSSC